jgi:hypothetical protein
VSLRSTNRLRRTSGGGKQHGLFLRLRLLFKKYGAATSWVGAFVSLISVYLNYQIGSTQSRIQSEAARTAQTGWLTPSKQIFAKTRVVDQEFLGYSSGPDLGQQVFQVGVAPSIDLSFYVYNRSDLPLTLVTQGFWESTSDDVSLWDELPSFARRSKDSRTLPDDAIGRTIEPRDSLLVHQKVSLMKTDPRGTTGAHILLVAESPFGRFSLTYIWIDYSCVLAAEKTPLFPQSDTIIIPGGLTRAEYRNHSYHVLQDDEERKLLKIQSINKVGESHKLENELLDALRRNKAYEKLWQR